MREWFEEVAGCIGVIAVGVAFVFVGLVALGFVGFLMVKVSLLFGLVLLVPIVWAAW
ncbi:MAG TPA: hypothetical protein VF250_02885 [Conexibacter sp.]